MDVVTYALLDKKIKESGHGNVPSKLSQLENDVGYITESNLDSLFTTISWDLCKDVEVLNNKMINPASQTVGQPIAAPAAYTSGYLVKVEVEPNKPIHFVCEQMVNQYSATGYNGKNASRFIAYTVAEDKFISGISYPQPGISSLIVPSNAK